MTVGFVRRDRRKSAARRSRVAPGVAVGALVIALSPGCSLFVSTNGLDNGAAQDGSTPDGGRGTPDARPRKDASMRDAHAVDAPRGRDSGEVDSTTPKDARVPVDARTPADVRIDTSRPVDAPVDVGHTPTPDAHTVDAGSDANVDWCSTQTGAYVLCADFDMGPVTKSFDLGLSANGVGGSIQTDPALFVSPPNSALGVADPYWANGGSGGDVLVGTLWSFGASPAMFRCAAAWNPQAVSTVGGDYSHIVAIEVNNSSSDQVVNLSVQMHSDGNLYLLEDYPGGAGDVEHALDVTVSLNTWYEVSMAFTTSATATTFAVSIEGGPTMETATGSLAKPVPAMSSGEVDVGPAYFGGDTDAASPGWTFAYDNVICF